MVNICCESCFFEEEKSRTAENAFFHIDFSAFPLAFFSQHLGFFSLNVTNQEKRSHLS